MNVITRLEEAILIAIWRLAENAYGVTVNQEVSRMVKKDYSMGALYFSLDQLHRKGMVVKELINPGHEQGGRSRTYYSLSIAGQEALQTARAYQQTLWEGVPEIISDRRPQE